MRMRLALCLLIPLVIIGGGAGTLFYTRAISQKILAPLSSIETLALRGDAPALSAHLDALEALWEMHGDRLMLIVDHDVIDCISLELSALRGAAQAHSAAEVCMAARRLRVHAQHLFRRDLPVPSNIL